MEGKTKMKIDVPGGCSTEELTRFGNLVKKIVSVPKEEINRLAKSEKEKKAKKGRIGRN